jgi:hypothetical protein
MAAEDYSTERMTTAVIRPWTEEKEVIDTPCFDPWLEN